MKVDSPLDSESIKNDTNASYIKCWNCKYFKIEEIESSKGECVLKKCKVDYPKWQYCESYDQCGKFRC
jgi:hypothetical protein